MSVKKAQQEIDSDEFTYWIAYFQYHCLDTEGWEQAAQVCSVIASSVGVKSSAKDYLPVKAAPQTGNEMLNEIMKTIRS